MEDQEVKKHWFMGDQYKEAKPRKKGTCEGCHFQVPRTEVCFVHIWNDRKQTQTVCGVRDVVFHKL